MKNLFYTIFIATFFFTPLFSHALEPGKLIITGFQGTSPSDPKVIKLKEKINQQKIGGIILFKRNIQNKTQLKALVQFLKKDTSIFVAIDHEGGIVNRLTDPTFKLRTPSPERFCQLDDSTQSKIASTISNQLDDIGINLNLGGVVDIAPLIKESSICRYKRCFGNNQAQISKCTQALFNAHKDKRLYFALKHFPGHGSTPIDSHYYLPDISKNHNGYDYMPYHTLIKENPSPYIMVMVGHLMVNHIDSKYPASLSKKHIDVLKSNLDFNGLIITDDLNMGALKEVSTNKLVIAKKAIEAGNDLLLFEFLTFSEIDQLNELLNNELKNSSVIKENIKHSSLKIQGNLSLNDR
ncbi:MAG: glycoside hydrolase family 3 N-terminal domain-containing protein [Candidatus Margulisiibacteriota bacterium]